MIYGFCNVTYHWLSKYRVCGLSRGNKLLPPSHVLGGLPQGGFARIPVCNHHHHHHGLWGGGGDDLVTTISPCRRLAVRPKMSGLRPHDWTWRLAAAVANLYFIVSVCLSLASLWSLSVIAIINMIITIKGGRLVLCLRRTIMWSLLRQKWSSSFMMIIISWAIKHYDDNQLFDGHHCFWWSSFLSPKGRSNIMMIISSLMFINIIVFSRWFIP